jgi:hypothetical protein
MIASDIEMTVYRRMPGWNATAPADDGSAAYDRTDAAGGRHA